MPASASPSCGASSFFKTELERALEEQAFGIVGYSITSASNVEASASVVLLERIQMVLTLTIRGYQITGGLSPNTPGAEQEFETLEALLQQCSPMYAAKRAELLISKLSA